MTSRKIMEIKYLHQKELIGRLKEILIRLNCPYVIFDDITQYKIYIDKGYNSWPQVIEAINSIHAAKPRYKNNCYIENGELHEVLFVSMRENENNQHVLEQHPEEYEK